MGAAVLNRHGVDIVSHPSTNPEPLVNVLADNADEQGSGSYDGYPFIEWEDLEDAEKRLYAATKVGTALAGQVRPTIAEEAVSDAQTGVVLASGSAGARNIILKAIDAALDEEAKMVGAANLTPKPARQGHLMAEGHMLRKARDHVSQGGQKYMQRKVVFKEPVNRFTCLKGDNLAVGGDMLTAVTVTDTTAYDTLDAYGRKVTMYEAKAINT